MFLRYLQLVGTNRITIYKRCCDAHSDEFKRVGLDLKNIKKVEDIDIYYLNYHRRNLDPKYSKKGDFS